jgi:hypothetical protein
MDETSLFPKNVSQSFGQVEELRIVDLSFGTGNQVIKNLFCLFAKGTRLKRLSLAKVNRMAIDPEALSQIMSSVTELACEIRAEDAQFAFMICFNPGHLSL